MPPWTVCESDVQIRALVVLTMASFGPGFGIGLSMKPVWPIFFITNAFIAAVPLATRSHYGVPLAYQHHSVDMAGAARVQAVRSGLCRRSPRSEGRTGNRFKLASWRSAPLGQLIRTHSRFRLSCC